MRPTRLTGLQRVSRECVKGQQKIRRTVFVAATILLGAVSALAQSGTRLDPAFAGDVGVIGKVAPGQQEVSIYDLSYPVATKLGSSTSIDRDGNFAVIIKPALILGHQIAAIDKNGRKSNIVVVIAHPSGPAGPPKK